MPASKRPEAQAIVSRQPIIFRVILLAAAIVYVAAIVVNAYGEWLSQRPTLENLTQGTRWNPDNPSLWTMYARYWLFAADGSQPAKASDAFLRAAMRNPLDPENWEGLAQAYLQMGFPDKAEAATRSRLVATPHAPLAAWSFANFLVAQGRVKEALPYLRIAAASDPAVRPAVFALAWKILDQPQEILREVVPPSFEAQAHYLSFLQERKKLAEAYGPWEEIRKVHSQEALNLGYTYVTNLANAGMGDEAARVWGEILEDTGRTWTRPRGELLTNGDFEADLVNAGLDWRFATGTGYRISLDNFVYQSGSRSLEVAFDGGSNPDFAEVSLLVPVEQAHEYTFRGYIKTENITSDSGLRFSITTVGGPPNERFELYSENRVGTNPWSMEQLTFRTGPHTHLVVVALRRIPSRKLNNLIQGKVWIDNLSLRAIGN